MKVTGKNNNSRRLNTDYLQKVSSEKKEYVGVLSDCKITENNTTITNFQTDKLLEEILKPRNMNNAYLKVKRNKGAGGIDGMQVNELLTHMKETKGELIQAIMDGKYKPNPVRRVEIPKEEKGKVRKLGIPTVVDRVIQQAIAGVLSLIYEKQFSENSYGFRPNRGAHEALKKCQENVNDGYCYVVDMDLEKFFDTVCQSKLIEILSRTIKDGRVISLIHKLYCYSEPLEVKQDEIHLLNGVLKTDGTFIEGKQFCTNRLNIEYHPEIRNGVCYPTSFLTFLNNLLDIDDIKTLQEFMGYCLIPSTKAQAMMFIIGNGGEGKSRIGIIMQEIFKNALLSGTFHRIETDKFFRINLKNKLVMLDDDMKMEGLPSTGYIKNLVTAEIPVDVEAKGMQSEQALLYARFLSFGNGSPKALYDKSDGFQRRLLVLTVKPIQPDRIKDPDIADKFIEEKEKVFIWMFDGLLRLIKNNFQFTVSDKTKRNVAEVMADNCNIIEFLQDSAYISFGTDFEESTATLYNAYSDWCNKNLLIALKKDTFSSWLKSNSYKYSITFTNHIKTDSRREVRGYKCIKTHYVSFPQ